MVYEWMDGFRSSVKAQEAGEIMRRLADDGELTPAKLVEEARPETSPLHRGFEWDDAKAAENYRRQQATIMIRAIVVKETDLIEGGNDEIRIKVFNMAEKGSNYEPLDVIMVDSYKTDSLLSRANEELRSFRRKYSQLSKLSKLMASINEYLEGA